MRKEQQVSPPSLYRLHSVVWACSVESRIKRLCAFVVCVAHPSACRMPPSPSLTLSLSLPPPLHLFFSLLSPHISQPTPRRDAHEEESSGEHLVFRATPEQGCLFWPFPSSSALNQTLSHILLDFLSSDLRVGFPDWLRDSTRGRAMQRWLRISDPSFFSLTLQEALRAWTGELSISFALVRPQSLTWRVLFRQYDSPIKCC